MSNLATVASWDVRASFAATGCADRPGARATAVRVLLDGQLHNRAELLDLLDERQISDEELLAVGYQRWGTGLAERLAGEFAFVIWDKARRQLYAARDPLGVRTLFYHADARRLAIATDVESLLARGDFERRLDDRSVFDYLLDQPRFVPETFFEGVHRLLPGHSLLADGHSVRQERYWRPHPRTAARGAPDCHGEFRRLFERAVEDRLASDWPLIAQLSGGLDSSSIVCVADAVYRRNGVKRPPLVTASAVFPGLDCDETPYLDAVARHVMFSSERWDGTAEGPWDGTVPATGDPWSAAPPGQADTVFDIARRHGSRAILSGFGGDELLFERGIFRDLAARGRWLQLLRESALAPRYSTETAWHFLQDGLRGLVPEAARSAYGRLRAGRRGPAPGWLAPRLRRFWSEPNGENGRAPKLDSCTQEMTWQRLTSGHMLLALEVQRGQAARHGVDVRYPFLDARLVQFVLGLPYSCRLPGGRMKVLLRKGLDDLLPRKIARRRRVTTFDTSIRIHLRRILPQVRAVLTDGAWASSAFLDRSQVLAAFNIIDHAGSGPVALDAWLQVWSFARFELWLRTIAGTYSASF
jgi:asparagine synthase (glutamine-hydrolysing)